MFDKNEIPQSRLNVMAVVDYEKWAMRAVMSGAGKNRSHDVKLTELSVNMGMLATSIYAKTSDGHEHLERIYSFTLGWLMALGVQNPQTRISNERDRQDALFVEGRISFNCASRIADANRKLRVLVEEVGEVAQEIDRLEIFTGITNKGRSWAKGLEVRKLCLREELIQVAAVAVAWLESLQMATNGKAHSQLSTLQTKYATH